MVESQNYSVVRFLQGSANRVPDRPALILDGTAPCTITFTELWTRVCNLAAGFVAEGLKPGDRAICMVPMSIDLYVCLLALLKMGAIVVFVDPWISPGRIAEMAAFSEPDAYVGVPKSHIVRLLNGNLRRIRITVTTGKRIGPIPARRTVSELEISGNANNSISPKSADDPALVTFTSGSSGTPKGANRTHGFLAAQHEALHLEFPYNDDDVDMPMFPVFALNNLALGITSVIPDMDFKSVASVDAGAIRGQIQRHGVTTCTASPPFFSRLSDLPATADGPLRLRRIITGGAPVADQEIECWQKALPGTEILVAYGSTEAEPVAQISATDRLQAKSDIRPRTPGFCVGYPIENIRTRVIRIHDRAISLTSGGWGPWDLAQGEIGELVVSGDHVCRDYYKNPEAVAQNKILEGKTTWHRMGDTGYFDKEGRFWIVGRVHSTMRRDGKEMHPQLIEQAARQDNPWQLAALGYPDSALDQKVLLVIFPGRHAVDRFALTQRLAEYGIVVDDILIENEPLPVDPRHNSKTDYDALRRRIGRKHSKYEH
jgi:acyl-CoA synthetase (AMP-forming)/AMP-acid ligase II